MTNRLFSHKSEPEDIWPIMFSMASLMLLLLPTLLFVLSPQKSTALPLSISTPDELPPTESGPIEGLSLRKTSSGFELIARIRQTDVRASEGDVEQKQWDLPNLNKVRKTLRSLKNLDPTRRRITLIPSPQSQTDEVVHWMDIIRNDDKGVLFPDVVLSGVDR